MQYMQRHRRMLLDIHVPDFDERFLERYDPARMAELYAAGQAKEVMRMIRSSGSREPKSFPYRSFASC